MRLTVPIPTRIKPDILIVAAGILLAGQLLTGTGILYALLIGAFVLLTGLCFNTLQGFKTIGGASVAFIALKIVIISQIAKVLFGQPADDYFRAPLTTAAVLVIGMASIYCAAAIASRIKFIREPLQPIRDPELLLRMAIITYIIGAGSEAYNSLFYVDTATGVRNLGGILGLTKQLTIALPLAVICGTAYTIVASGKEKSLGLVAAIPMLTLFVVGLLQAAKHVLLAPPLYYLLTCIAFGFPFRLRHVASICAFALFAILVLVPYSEVGRTIVRADDSGENIAQTVEFITSIAGVEEIQALNDAFIRKSISYAEHQYYGSPMGLLDRWSLIEQDDSLIAASLQKGFTGWYTILPGFAMLVPRALYPDKPAAGTGNFLGHRIESLGINDDTTQVSFGIIAESFSAFSWLGTILIPFLLMFSFILIYNNLFGNVVNNIWVILLIGMFQHSMVEQNIASTIAIIGLQPVIIIALALASTWLARATLPAYQL